MKELSIHFSNAIASPGATIAINALVKWFKEAHGIKISWAQAACYAIHHFPISVKMMPIDANLRVKAAHSGITIILPEYAADKLAKIARNLNMYRQTALAVVLMATIQQLKLQDDAIAEWKALENPKKPRQKRHKKYIGVREWKFDD